ncbi:CHAT domain [Serratia fonticola]|uniref:CHAT domain-containing protein n=1 Tax=Serratia fonticola TaxID=47917 RepID=UPI0021799DD7|nr:CHAT domain-containing protein [Serratia fonticola]CAI1191662.1 CHAT domain [Serratia fonticola]
MELLKNSGDIVKIVIMPTLEKQTFFQGFDAGITHPEVAEILLLLNKTPKNIMEIFVRDEREATGSLETSSPIILISKENVNNVFLFSRSSLSLIFCARGDFSFSKEFSKKFEVPPIICCDVKSADIRPGEINSIFSFDKLLLSRLKLIEKSNPEIKITGKLKRRGTTFKKTTWQSTLNNTTLPNELLIESLGFMLSPSKKIKDGSSRREFINNIIGSVVAYNDCLEEIGKKNSSEIILYTPGMFSFLHNKDNDFFALLEEGLEPDERRFLINGVLRNPDYSGFRMVLENKENKASSLLNNPRLVYLISLRRAEMRLTTAAISLLCSNKNAPSIRLPNEINHCSSHLKKLETLAGTVGLQNPLFLKKAKAFNTILRRVIGSKIRAYINDNYNNIFFVSDVPLDWTRFNNIPIMFSHEISRINATPGNILLQNASSFPRVVIKSSELKKVLVIRSFEPDDPLKFFLENALEVFKKHMPKLECEIVDVRTKSEIIDVLNQYDGCILIMDCHGDHGGDRDNGWLVIGDEKVDTWHFKGIARVPPIVILSACLTSALSGSHASVSNGFMVSGALSVIGTLLPVNAVDSAVFVSRLVYRFYEFPSVIPNHYTHVNMRLFLSLFLRMSYVTDLMRGFEREGFLPKDSWQDEHININTHINMLNSDWYDYTINSISKLTKLNKQEVNNVIESKLFITETMCYSQIGLPESITIRLQE